ncbi:MAG TPA: DNA-binding protein [Telluria sp.]
MAKGITENDVHAAADAVLAGGDRPTVERIRAHLGTGSPNTVTRWLETWWRAVGTRLTAQHARLALPEAPTEVAAAASRLWELALQRAGADAEARFADQRAGLAQAHDELAEREAATQMQAQAAARDAAQARDALEVTETRLADLQRLLAQQTTQLQELQRERAEGHVRFEALAAELAQVRTRAEAAAQGATVERDTLLQQIRGNEERSAAEIDRARQETKRLQAEAKTAARQHQQALATARQHGEALERDLQVARRQGDEQRVRAEALEQQLARLADLPAQLEATLQRVRPKATPARTTPRKRTKPGGS